EGDSLADFAAAHSPEFAQAAVRDTVAVASGFTKGVFNGMIAPATMAYQYTAPAAFVALGGNQMLQYEHDKKVNDQLEKVEKTALEDGKRRWGNDYTLSDDYVAELRQLVEKQVGPIQQVGGAA